MEGVIQEYPLAIVAYSIGINSLTKNLKAEFPDVNQTWYDDDAGALSTFTRVG